MLAIVAFPHQIHEVGRANPSPSRTTLLVECVETFLGIIELDDVADRLDHILDRAAVLKIVRPHEKSRASSITSGDFIAKSLASARPAP